MYYTSIVLRTQIQLHRLDHRLIIIGRKSSDPEFPDHNSNSSHSRGLVSSRDAWLCLLIYLIFARSSGFIRSKNRSSRIKPIRERSRDRPGKLTTHPANATMLRFSSPMCKCIYGLFIRYPQLCLCTSYIPLCVRSSIARYLFRRVGITNE